MKGIRSIVAAAFVVSVAAAGVARAGTVYSEDFDSGTATFGVSDPGWKNAPAWEGVVVKTTEPSFFSDEKAITHDVGGSGYFLFEGTGATVNSGGFYISDPFAVTPNSTYVVSFYLTNAAARTSLGPMVINGAQVQPTINGVTLGPAVTATGYFTQDAAHEWQKFSFVWNSGSSTQATLTLNDLQLTTFGNDFGIDDISVTSATAVPLPAALPGGLACVGALLVGRRWRGSKAATLA